ncbi:MAG: hypothetical protein EYC70_16200 [Planctomycetota bacterium]|nr:MAG: hypothetical protein EYC70_16200 [Planctomycetota bacterium]
MLAASPLTAQVGQVFLVDGSNPNATYRNITSAANLAVAGDVIVIKGMRDNEGDVVAYSETTYSPNFNLPETFPITIQPGVRVTMNISGPSVVVWSTDNAPPIPPALFTIAGSATDSLTTKIEDITFVGGPVAVLADNSGGQFVNLTLKNVSLVRNVVGLSAAMDRGSRATITVKDCKLGYRSFPDVSPEPIYQNQSIGLRFQGLETFAGQIGRIRAGSEVVNLTTEGLFTTMSPQGWQNPITDMNDLSMTGTRLIEVYASGITDEHEDMSPYNLRASGIASVDLAVSGGVWDGQGASSAGWDVGLYAATATSTGFKDDYTAGYKVSLSGTTIREFRMAGIHATAGTDTRGEIEVAGGVTVRDTGLQVTHGAGSFFYSGVHMFTLEGYLALDAATLISRDNTGNGVWLHSGGNVQRDTNLFPNGLYAQMTSCDFHYNDGSGVSMAAGTGSASGNLQGGIVGGTWDFFPTGSRSLVAGNNGEPSSFPEHYGQGYMNRCDISNNGEYGLRTQATGNFMNNAGYFSAASLRLVNTYIWNNASGGYFAELAEDAPYPEDIGPYLLVPLQHCALIGNGDANNWTANVVQTAGTASLFGWSDGAALLRTHFRETILQRATSTNSDYGTGLIAVRAADTSTGVPATAIGIGGMRSYEPPGASFGPSSTFAPAPFQGPINYASTDASQFFLTTNANPWGSSPNFLVLDAVEAATDYRGDTTRPSVVSGQRDKGGEEL